MSKVEIRFANIVLTRFTAHRLPWTVHAVLHTSALVRRQASTPKRDLSYFLPNRARHQALGDL